MTFLDTLDWGDAAQTEFLSSLLKANPEGLRQLFSHLTLTAARESGEPIYLDNLSWTPDGTALRFTAFLGGRADYALYQVLTDGSGLTEIAKIEWRPRIAWSPDGSRVAVVDDRIGSHRDGLVYTMASDGSDKLTIVVEGLYGPAAANGERLVGEERPDQRSPQPWPCAGLVDSGGRPGC